MKKYIIHIHVETDADPSTIHDNALEFGNFFEEMTSEELHVDEALTSVGPVEENRSESKFDFEFVVTTKVTAQQVCNLLATAFDGPTTASWARCESVNMPAEPDWSWCTEKERKDWESVRKIYVAAMCGGSIVIVDYESESDYDGEGPAEHIIEIDREKIRHGLKVMNRDHPRHFSDFINGNDDAITGDVFVQCCCFGEVIYG